MKLQFLFIRDNTRIECYENEFTCGDGSCIDKSNLCNGVRDCPDDEDEDPINCPSEPPFDATTTEEFEEDIDTDTDTDTEYSSSTPTATTEYSTDVTTEYCKLFISCVQIKTKHRSA